MNEPPIQASKRPAPRTLLLILLGVLLGVLAFFFASRSSNAALTRDRLTAAREKWRQKAPASYDLEVVVSGRQGATYEVRVRDGKVAAALRNHVPLQQERTFRTWSVPGMFDTMESDVDSLEFALAHPDDPKRIMLTLRAEFDPQTGMPLQYLRSQWGTQHDVAWKVSRFEVK